ncbi:hypothetical protein VCR15J2_390009 [Vibrio coralliirubri]|uniref:hypothetical protein n=1 Tax=Vibrio coralliirubri TaxID=1516159 RepID=UPI0006325D0A|nr:hypothetical protein [Vibrio coralliirubri]CDT52591.1 hypothetical protein VCR15J2_390009 [Vibrio coralliirubri]
MACMSSSFVPNAKGALYRAAGFTRYGEARFRKQGVYPITILKFKEEDKEVSIRVDRSASKSMARQETSDVEICISPRSKVKVSDMMIIKRRKLKVVTVEELYDLLGDLVHYEVGLQAQQADGDNVYGD